MSYAEENNIDIGPYSVGEDFCKSCGEFKLNCICLKKLQVEVAKLKAEFQKQKEFLIVQLNEMRKEKKLEHDNFLIVHRENMKLVGKNIELKEKLAAIESLGGKEHGR